MNDGLHVYDNPVGVLTNNPPFPQAAVSTEQLYEPFPEAAGKPLWRRSFRLSAYSRGMGALGLPGDLSSASRFVRVAFTRLNAVSGEFGNRKRQPVFPYFRIGRTAARLL